MKRARRRPPPSLLVLSCGCRQVVYAGTPLRLGRRFGCGPGGDHDPHRGSVVAMVAGAAAHLSQPSPGLRGRRRRA